jgi:hypothetical protein
VTRPALLLRGESAALLALAVALFAENEASWWLFLVLILAPDLSALGYLAGQAVGAAAYNVGHCAALPALLALAGLWQDQATTIGVALIWFAHIAGDRAIGYGFKYPGSIKETHLQQV